MYFIYAGLAVASTIITYFYIPETKQNPVGEIGALFGDKVVVRLTADGHGLVTEDITMNTFDDGHETARKKHEPTPRVPQSLTMRMWCFERCRYELVSTKTIGFAWL
jgi:hypothetical protein